MPKIKHNNNIAFVASTLPVAFIKQNAKEWSIGTILVASSALANSYEKLKIENHKFQIITISGNVLNKIILLAYYIAISKLLNRNIYFFHECCCLSFDILVGIFKPKGYHFPQVTLNSFVETNFSQVKLNKSKLILFILGLKKSFTPYLIDVDNNKGSSIIWARTNYPKSINQYAIGTKKILKTNINLPLKNNVSNNILIILGTDVVESEVIREQYVEIIDELYKRNYNIYAKDHPNPQSRLELVDNRLIYIDPYLPVELVEDNFDYIIGVGSTGLLLYQNRAISIIRFWSKRNSILVARRVNHLLNMQNGHLIKFPLNLTQMMDLIQKKKIN